MEVKAPFDKYFKVSRTRTADPAKFRETAAYLMSQDKLPYEFRMTVVPQFQLDDITEAAREVAGARIFYLQPYVDHGMGFKPPSKDFLAAAREACLPYVNTEVR